MEVNFTVYGEPVGKGRPKFSRQGGRVVTYTPEKTANYETLVRWEYTRQCGNMCFPDGEKIEANITAYFSIPKSASKKGKKAMLAGELRPTKKPDLDNVIKAICDSLNTVAYRDDTQVVDCYARKFYSEKPRVEIMLRTAKSEIPRVEIKFRTSKGDITE